ncbi:MAG: hypothetical protein HUJ51_01825 [Eggerthellaceae bacterium]|nr:hypothetical protein [Eggerthellaceae bacterium]
MAKKPGAQALEKRFFKHLKVYSDKINMSYYFKKKAAIIRELFLQISSSDCPLCTLQLGQRSYRFVCLIMEGLCVGNQAEIAYVYMQSYANSHNIYLGKEKY